MTSTSTVGLPRLSRISRPMMSVMAVMGGSDIDNAGLLQDGLPPCHALRETGIQGPQTPRQANGEETTAAGPPKPDPQFPGPGHSRSCAEPPCRHELYCTVYGTGVYDPLPYHRPT